MQWSKRTPKIPGYYAMRVEASLRSGDLKRFVPTIVKLDQLGQVWEFGCSEPENADTFVGFEWSGPIELSGGY